MRIAVLGTGTVGRTLAGKCAELGHEVVIGTREPEATLARTEPDAMGNPPYSAWQAEHPDVRIIYASGIPRHIALASGLVEPDAPYLEKPVSADLLESLIRGQVTKFVPARDSW